MQHPPISEKFLIHDITQASEKTHTALRGLPINMLIKMIRMQMGMSQKILAKHAGVPQSTVSRVEQGQKDIGVSTLQKILDALSCDLIMAPVLRAPIDVIRRNQAKKIAKKNIQYLAGTMRLDGQQPNSEFMDMLLKREEDILLEGKNSKLWEE